MMKPLYYLEFADSISNNQPIPANELKWYTPFAHRVAYTDCEVATQHRYNLQKIDNNRIIRVKRAGFFKGLAIRFSSYVEEGSNWVIID